MRIFKTARMFFHKIWIEAVFFSYAATNYLFLVCSVLWIHVLFDKMLRFFDPSPIKVNYVFILLIYVAILTEQIFLALLHTYKYTKAALIELFMLCYKNSCYLFYNYFIIEFIWFIAHYRILEIIELYKYFMIYKIIYKCQNRWPCGW